jgi:hypothetical protein
MFGFVLTPFAKIVAIIAAVVAVFATGYYKGYKNTQDKFDTYKAEVVAVAAQQTAKTEVINKKNTQVAKETSDAYKTNLNRVREYYDRVLNDGSGSMPYVSDSPTGTNATSSNNVLVRQCAETTLQIVTLQEFIKQTAINY